MNSLHQAETLARSRVPTGCNLCGKNEVRPLFKAKADDGRDTYNIVQCRNCELVCLCPMPEPSRLAEYYAGEYYGPENKKFEAATERAVALFTWWRGRVLSRLVPRVGRVLDVGCGRGNFLETMSARGFDVYGTELSALSATRSRALFAGRVHIGQLAEASFADNYFDLAVIWHVLEHVYTPMEHLKELYRTLKSDGHVVVAVPNFASWQAKLGKARWFHLDPPRHLYHFTPKTITAMLRKAGFEPVAWSHYSIEQNPYGLLQTMLNFLPLPQNALYHMLKMESGLGINLWTKALLRLAYYSFMPIAIVLTTIESLFKKGGSFYVVARKPA